MRVKKWTPDFRPNVESPIVPIWFNFENLPIHPQDKRALFDIAGLVGRPLKLDVATTSLTKPYVAPIFTQVDLSKDMPRKIWIQCGSMGFSQAVGYENSPMYCIKCLYLGHIDVTCPKRPQVGINGASANGKIDKEPGKTNTTEKWVQKPKSTGPIIITDKGVMPNTGKDKGVMPSTGKDKRKACVQSCIPSTSKGCDSDTDTEEVYNETLIPGIGNNTVNQSITLDSPAANILSTSKAVPEEHINISEALGVTGLEPGYFSRRS
ncbi:unnamed protein product [Cuscuta europaea]|uniref:DUF4283 domain-containing protein n=1 Tax=Cuscuta europaea TaxID=41803 RepID=A0A9P1EDA9_CUSEU|nr:unnamed protein product [Cuscuta europaea]